MTLNKSKNCKVLGWQAKDFGDIWQRWRKDVTNISVNPLINLLPPHLRTWSFSQSPIISLKSFCVTKPTHWIQQQQNSNNNYAYKVSNHTFMMKITLQCATVRGRLSLHKVWPMIFDENQLEHFKWIFYRHKSYLDGKLTMNWCTVTYSFLGEVC